MNDEFSIHKEGLSHAIDLMLQNHSKANKVQLPKKLPTRGLGSISALEHLAPEIFGRAAPLGNNNSFAHMDPPTPWITWATNLWNASLNQNLLHPATAPAARAIEEKVIEWVAPFFGMSGGHITPGSTVSNLTALWAARELTGARKIISSNSVHISIKKAANLLGLEYVEIPSDQTGALITELLPINLNDSIMVLTAGTTATGAIDSFEVAGDAAWTHIDAAWAGPLIFTKYARRLEGIKRADSIAVSAHKWLFQPKECAMILFKNAKAAHNNISYGGSYLAAPNVGILGSHGASAVPLIATLLALGKNGIVELIETCMASAEEFSTFISREPRLELFAKPKTGVVVWRPRNANIFEPMKRRIPAPIVSDIKIGGENWFRNVAANPNANIAIIVDEIKKSMN